MLRRLPTFLSLAFAATVGLFALTSVLTAQPTTPPGDNTGVKRNQEENLKLFKRFSEEVLRLAQKWEKSDANEDKERAKSLRSALKLIEEKGVEKLFKELIEGLGSKNLNGGDFNTLIGNDRKLMEALERILDVLNTEDEWSRIQKEISDLKKAIEAVQKLKRDQENLRARNDNPKSDANKLAKDQKDLATKTQDTANALDKGNKDNKGKPNEGGDKPDPKSEAKAEPKPGENTAETKPDTKESKADDKGDGMGMPMGGDPKAGEPKPGAPMGGMSPGGDKPAPKDGDPKAGEPKPGSEPKPKPMNGDSKSQGSGKGESKPSAGMPGGEGKPMGGDGMPPDGMAPPSPGGSKGGGSPPPGGQQNPNKPKDPAAQEVQQAVPQQQGAEDDIKNNKKEEASKKQDEAIKRLENALAELEKRLKQLREKELAKLLQNLEERVGRMLKMEIEVKASTEGIDKTVKALGSKPAVAEIQKSQAEADKQSAIIAEAEKTLKLMEGEGTAVVFAGVLNQVKGDMESVQKRLNEARVGEDTQQIEQDVIDQLKMMLEALKKAKQDLENKPSEPKPGDPPPPPNNKLLELLAELKLIKFQQETLNKRTVMYHKQDPGEQAKDTLIQAELARLAANQKVLQEMLHKIATQANQ